MTERENRLRSGVEPPAIESHLAKYRSLIPSIALISHLVDGDRGPVPLDPLERAIRWGTYLESHARRIYAPGIEPAISREHGYIERFNGMLRDKLPNGENFYTLKEAKILFNRWRTHHNTVRSHLS